MRKVFLSAMVFASVMAFTSCNNEEIIVVEGGNGTEQVDDVLQAGEAIFEIGVTNTGVGTSRAGRPVGSSAAANDVNKVKIVVYKKNGSSWEVDNAVKIKNVDGTSNFTDMEINWSAGPNGEGDSTTDRYGKHKVKLEGLSAGTTYKFVAYGYKDQDVYAFNDGDSNLIFESANALEKYNVEEVFAGQTQEITTTVKDEEAGEPGGRFDGYVSVILERQVAGMLGYFENVPSRIGEEQVAKIEVRVGKKFTKISIPSFTEFNGLADGKEDGGEVLLTFDLSKIATNYEEAYVWGAPYKFADWTNGKQDDGQPAPLAEGYTAPKDLKLKANSIFGGRFILPYDNHYDEQTLVVRMLNAEGKELKAFNVTTNQSGFDKNQYDIRRNNFYSVGKKLKSDTTTPDPEDPDKPIDLSKNTDITVIINDAWDVLHDMGIED